MGTVIYFFYSEVLTKPTQGTNKQFHAIIDMEHIYLPSCVRNCQISE